MINLKKNNSFTSIFFLRINILFFIIILFINLSFAYGDEELKNFHYNIDVQNYVVPFRVLRNGEFVSGLKKEDFKLLVNGKKTNIENFWMEKKKMTDTEHQRKRLFVLIFNISDYKLDIRNKISYFFDKILRNEDNLIIISNNFILDRGLVSDKIKIKESVDNILEFETKQIRKELINIRSSLYNLLVDTKTFLVPGIDPAVPRRLFINGYLSYLRDFKKNYMNLSSKQYIKLIKYLKELNNVDKWVINFYELGGFYRPEYGFDTFETFLSASLLYRDVREELDTTDKLPIRDLSRLFIGTGAVINTVFMFCKPRPDIELPDGSWKLTFKIIASNSEMLLSKAAKYTGGDVFSSNKTEKFFKKIKEKEDVLYNLTYSLVKEKKNNKNNVKIIPVKGKYKILYDNKRISGHLKNIIENKKFIPDIVLEDINIKENTLNILVSNLNLIKKSSKENRVGNLNISITISNKTKRLFKRKKEFKSTKSNFKISIKLPKLKKDEYYFVIEAKDLNTQKNDVKIKKIKL